MTDTFTSTRLLAITVVMAPLPGVAEAGLRRHAQELPGRTREPHVGEPHPLIRELLARPRRRKRGSRIIEGSRSS